MATTKKQTSEFAAFQHQGLCVLKNITKLVDKELQPRIGAAENRLRHERVKLLVVGEFSRGKSTFINAIVGEPVLPSKVTPTTATINVIRGGVERLVTIYYEDGNLEQYPLPETQSNLFLSEIVTASNHNSQQIAEVVLTLPGRLNDCLVDVIDTPGVNDLNKLREDITFRYLNECDAAVILLDAQQPLTETERQFLRQRVVGADVKKILFVINRIDDKVVDADELSEQKLIELVQRRLKEEVDIEMPQVFAISALEALKSRFRKDRNRYLDQFETFEQHFLAFANEQATTGRAENHRNRILQIASDGLVQIENELVSIQLQGEEVETTIRKQREKLQAAEEKIRHLPAILDGELSPLRASVLLHGKTDLMERRKCLLEELDSIETANQIDQYQADIHHSLQSWMNSLSRQTWKESKKLVEKIRSTNSKLFSSSSSLIVSSSNLSNLITSESMNLDVEPAMQAPEQFGSSDMIFGGLAGLIASWMIGGPVAGILVGLLGTGLAGGVRKQAEIEAALEQQKTRIANALQMHLESLESKLPEVVEKIIQRERKLILEALTERAKVTTKSLQDSIDVLQRLEGQDESQRLRKQQVLVEKKEALVDMIQETLGSRPSTGPSHC